MKYTLVITVDDDSADVDEVTEGAMTLAIEYIMKELPASEVGAKIVRSDDS